MSTLAEKRKFHYEARHTHNETNLSLGNIDLNTDQVEAKLDTIISNTSHNEFTGYSSTVIGGGATATTITAVDLGSASAPHKINIVGTTTHNNIDNIIEVSNDNVTYYELPNIVISVVGTKISAIGDICFRYFRMKTTDNTGSPVTVVIEYNAKNIN